MDDGPYLFYIIFVTYTMLPLPKVFCVVFGALTALLQLLISGLMSNSVTDYLWMQVSGPLCDFLDFEQFGVVHF